MDSAQDMTSIVQQYILVAFDDPHLRISEMFGRPIPLLTNDFQGEHNGFESS